MKIINNNYKDLQNDKFSKITLILIYADWCPYSVRFFPLWQKLIKNIEKNKKEYNIYIGTDNDVTKLKKQRKNKILKDVMKQFSGYPNLFIIKKNKIIKIEIGDNFYTSNFNLYNHINKKIKNL